MQTRTFAWASVTGASIFTVFSVIAYWILYSPNSQSLISVLIFFLALMSFNVGFSYLYINLKRR